MEHHHHPPVTGADGELIELFIQLVDRTTSREPHWWHTYGQFTLLNFNHGFFPDEMSREDAMQALRDVLTETVRAGMREDFLIKSLRRELDDYVQGKEDPSRHNQQADGMRQHLERVIEDPQVRAAWRAVMAKRNPEWATMSDDDIIRDSQKTLDAERMITRHLSPDEVAERWAESAEWWEASRRLLPDIVFKHWDRLKAQRDRDRS